MGARQLLGAIPVQIAWKLWKHWKGQSNFPLNLGRNGRWFHLWTGWNPPQPD